MEEILDDFISYLYSIGIISNNNTADELLCLYHDVIQSHRDNNNEEIIFKDDMTNALINYINNLSNDKLKLLGLNIILKYVENRQSKQIEKLKSAVLLSTRYQHGRLWRYLIKWKYHQPIQRKKDCSVIDNNTIKHQPNNNNHHQHKRNQHYRLETSWEKKEREDFEQCTFRPITNTNRNRYKGNSTYQTTTNQPYQTTDNTNISVYERLYSDKDKYKMKKEMLAMTIQSTESSIATFCPKFIATPKNVQYKPIALFDERQKSFISSKSKNRERIQTEMDEHINMDLTFTPHINKRSISPSNNNTSYVSTVNNTTPAHVRLYNDNSRRKQQSMNMTREAEAESRNNTSLINTQGSNHNYTKSVDYNKIEQLYNKYKTKQMSMNKLRKEIDEENGVTFKPTFQNRDSVYNQKVNTSLLERSQKCIDEKKAFIDIYQQELSRHTKEQQVGYRNYSREEKDVIAQRIIDRLYKPEIEKQSQRKALYSKITNAKSPTSINPHPNPYQKNIKSREQDQEIEGLSSDLIISQSNDSEHPCNTKQTNQNPYQTNNSFGKDDDDNNDFGRYNDKIISLDEYTLGLNKRKNKDLASFN